MSVIVKGMEMPSNCKDCGFRYRDGDIWRCKSTDERLRLTNNIRDCDCPLKSIEGLIAEIEHITPKATMRYGKLSIDSCLMIPVDKVIETIKEYCEVK